MNANEAWCVKGSLRGRAFSSKICLFMTTQRLDRVIAATEGRRRRRLLPIVDARFQWKYTLIVTLLGAGTAAIMGGLLVATLLTLFFEPALYSLVYRVRRTVPDPRADAAANPLAVPGAAD